MKRTLIISTQWEPMYFASEKKAANLVVRGVVEVISTWEGEQFIPQMGLELPATLRLTDYVKRTHKMPKFRRRVVFARDNYTCQYCGKHLAFRELTIDHVKPTSLGGKSEWKNCVTACKPCNKWKANKSLDKAGMRLIAQPEFPTVVHFWDLRVGNLTWHSDWDQLITR